MPNHITNVIRAENKAVIHALLTEAGVDFNRVIPRPDRDDPIFTAERTDYGDGSFGYSVGGYSPMDWARTHWGTKWNAYEHEVRGGDLEVKFETAWNHPSPVVEALSRQFPTERIFVKYADEDTGYNLGEYFMLNGEVISETVFDFGSPEAKDFAAMLCYGQTYAELESEWAS